MNGSERSSAEPPLGKSNLPGRICPLRYRYGPAAIARAESRGTHALYAVGGLYGNVPALDAVEQLARHDVLGGAPALLCFNGDFNWFNIDDAWFGEVNRRVLAHDATLGNVEAELDSPLDEAGCGCAYPATVDAGVVERSNRIHAKLKQTAARHAILIRRIAALPMVARYQVAGCRVGVVHGDAEALAGWQFDVNALDDPAQRRWLESAFAAAEVDVFACTHTCLPALRSFPLASGGLGCVVNNGAAGMPNFAGELSGLCTRIAVTPSPHPVVHEVRIAGAYVALVPVPYDAALWMRHFLAQWPQGSPAWVSYFERIARGPAFTRARAVAAHPAAMFQ